MSYIFLRVFMYKRANSPANSKISLKKVQLPEKELPKFPIFPHVACLFGTNQMTTNKHTNNSD